MRSEPWGSGSEGFGPKMCSLTSRVLLCTVAEFFGLAWEVRQRCQYLARMEYPEVPWLKRGAARLESQDGVRFGGF